MRAGVLQLSRWGLLDRGRRGRHAAGRGARCSTTPTASRSTGLDPPQRRAWTRSTPRAGRARPAARRCRRRGRGRACFASTTVTDARARRAAASRVCGSCRGRAGTATLRARITIGADGIGSVVAAGRPGRRRAPGRRPRPRSSTATSPTSRRTGYEWAYGDARRLPGCHPDQRRGDLRLRRAPRPPGCASCVVSAPTQAFATLLDRAAPALADRVAAARPVSRLHGWAAHPGFVRRSWRAGLGAGRRRRLLQGPDHHPRHHRRAARRRAARRRGRSACWPVRCRRPSR